MSIKAAMKKGLSNTGLQQAYLRLLYLFIDIGILDLEHDADFVLIEVIGNHLFDTRKEFGEIRDI